MKTAGTASRATGGMILLVEDEESVGTLVRTYLDRHGFRVCWVRTGEEALTEFTRHPIRLVVLDIGLPGMNWVEVARQLRAEPGLRQARLVAVTGDEAALDVLQSLDASLCQQLRELVRA